MNQIAAMVPICTIMVVWLWVQCGVVGIACGTSRSRASKCYNAYNRLRLALPPASRVRLLCRTSCTLGIKLQRVPASTAPPIALGYPLLMSGCNLSSPLMSAQCIVTLVPPPPFCFHPQDVFQAGPLVTLSLLISFVFATVLMHAASSPVHAILSTSQVNIQHAEESA